MFLCANLRPLLYLHSVLADVSKNYNSSTSELDKQNPLGNMILVMRKESFITSMNI